MEYGEAISPAPLLLARFYCTNLKFNLVFITDAQLGPALCSPPGKPRHCTFSATVLPPTSQNPKSHAGSCAPLLPMSPWVSGCPSNAWLQASPTVIKPINPPAILPFLFACNKKHPLRNKHHLGDFAQMIPCVIGSLTMQLFLIVTLAYIPLGAQMCRAVTKYLGVEGSKWCIWIWIYQLTTICAGLLPRRCGTPMPGSARRSSRCLFLRTGAGLDYKLQSDYEEYAASFCVGNFDIVAVSQDPKSLQLLAGLVEAAMKSPLRGKMWIIMLMI